MKKLLLIGSTGSIGNAIKSSLQRFHNRLNLEVLLTSRDSSSSFHYLDLLDTSSRWPDIGPCDFVVCAAGSGDIKTCHDFPKETRRVNVDCIEQVAEKYLLKGGRLAYFSSTQVFSGQRPFVPFDTKPDPCTELGRQKHEAELLVKSLGGLVVRSGKALRPNEERILKWIEDATQGQVVGVPTNLRVSWTSLSAISEATLNHLINTDTPIIHVSARDEWSYFEVARFVLSARGLDTSFLKGTHCDLANFYAGPVPRILHASLEPYFPLGATRVESISVQLEQWVANL